MGRTLDSGETMMRNLGSVCLSVILFAFLWGLVGYLAPVSAHSQIGPDYVPFNPLISVDTGDLRLTYSQAYTVYIPLIHVPPPPNPKKGVGVVRPPACTDMRNLDASWYFTWSPFPDPTCTVTENNRFIPRISNAQSMAHLGTALNYAKQSGWLIGFTEPNLPWQSNLTPAQGAVLWKQIEEAADAVGGIKLVSPSPNQYNPGEADPYGHQWLWAMVSDFNLRFGRNPRFDAIGWNIYKQSPNEITAYLTARRNEALVRGYNVPIWVLEYAGECWRGSGSNNQSIMTATTAWFDATPWIGRYAWFANRLSGSEPNAVGWQSCSLVNPQTGALTSLGQIYKLH
jgi:hypothetical protein